MRAEIAQVRHHLEEALREVKMLERESRWFDFDLHKDTGYGDDLLQLLGNGWQQLSILQRNLLIVIARNYVLHSVGEEIKNPFTVDVQKTEAELPRFSIGSPEATGVFLNALVGRMRSEIKADSQA
jgi:hypothetical protein